MAFSIYSSLFHTFHNQLPSSFDSTCVICPTPFCISTALFQFFIILDLWCDPGILTGLPTSCFSYPQSIVYTAAGQLPFLRASETCLQQQSSRTTTQDLYNFTWSSGHSSLPAVPFIHSMLQIKPVAWRLSQMGFPGKQTPRQRLADRMFIRECFSTAVKGVMRKQDWTEEDELP